MAQNSAAVVNTVVPLSEKNGPLVWIDCEMTGLDPAKDKLLEIAVIITNGDLERVDDGINLIIHREKEVLDKMDQWCTDQHGSTGLTQACLESTHTVEAVSSQVLSYIQKWIPQKKIAHLSGNSVHQDRLFLLQEMPEVVNWLHYRIVDVSSIKVLTKRWCPQYAHVPGFNNHRYPSNLHSNTFPDWALDRALDDILGSIQELQSYRQNIFLRAAHTTKGAGDGRAVNADIYE
ncbi:oligoribonuclease [Amanita muscaria]